MRILILLLFVSDMYSGPIVSLADSVTAMEAEISPAIAAPALTSASEAKEPTVQPYYPNAAPSLSGYGSLIKVRPLKLVYEEVPVGSTPDPNVPEIGPDGKEIPFHRWGDETPPPLQPATTPLSAKEAEPSFTFDIAKPGGTITSDNRNLSVVPGASATSDSSKLADSAAATATATGTGSVSVGDEATNGLGQKIIRNGKIKGQGTWPQGEPEQPKTEECYYIDYGFTPCGFGGVFFAYPVQYPFSSGYFGDYPYVAPYAHRSFINEYENGEEVSTRTFNFPLALSSQSHSEREDKYMVRAGSGGGAVSRGTEALGSPLTKGSPSVGAPRGSQTYGSPLCVFSGR